MRIVFLGSPQFALPSLKALSNLYSVEAVISQPDRPAGRGRKPSPPPTKMFANEAGIPVYQPERIKDDEALKSVAQFEPDLLVVAAYGQILPQSLLDMAEYGSLNVHASLLPRWRGASPIQAAIRNGDKESGVTVMLMDAGLDTGPIISQRKVQLSADETGGTLTERLSIVGSELLIETLPHYLSEDITPRPQDDALATHAPMLRKEDGALDLTKPADQLARLIRAYDPWPGTFILWGERRLAVKQGHASFRTEAKAGEVLLFDGVPAIGTVLGLLTLDVVQPSGKRAMSGEAFVRGTPEFIGVNLLDH